MTARARVPAGLVALLPLVAGLIGLSAPVRSVRAEPGDRAERIEAVETESSPEALIRALADPDSGIRWRAAFRLRQLSDQTPAARRTLSFALDDENRTVAIAAAHALARHPEIAPRLAGRVLGSASVRRCLLLMGPRARAAAARIGRMLETARGNDAAILIDLLEQLGPFAEHAAPALGAIAKNEPAAFRALAAIGHRAVPVLIELLDGTATRDGAARALAAIGRGAAPAADALLKRNDERADPFAHGARLTTADLLDPIQRALAALGPNIVPGLLRALDGSNPGRAMVVLGALGPAAGRAAPAIRQRLETLDKKTGVLAAWTLARIDPHHERTLALLRQALRTRDAAAPLRVASFQALQRLAAVREGDRTALLDIATSRTAPGLRAVAVRLLAYGAALDLRKLNGDPSGEVGAAVAFARSRWHGENASAALLADDDRVRLMRDLGALGSARDWVIAALDDGVASSDAAVRREATRQRMRLRPHDVAFALAALRDPSLTTSAREILAAFGPAAKPALLAAARNPTTRKAAVAIWRQRPPADLDEARAALPLAPQLVPKHLAAKLVNQPAWTRFTRAKSSRKRAAAAYWTHRLARPVTAFLRDPVLAVRLAALGRAPDAP